MVVRVQLRHVNFGCLETRDADTSITIIQGQHTNCVERLFASRALVPVVTHFFALRTVVRPPSANPSCSHDLPQASKQARYLVKFFFNFFSGLTFFLKQRTWRVYLGVGLKKKKRLR